MWRLLIVMVVACGGSKPAPSPASDPLVVAEPARDGGAAPTPVDEPIDAGAPADEGSSQQIVALSKFGFVTIDASAAPTKIYVDDKLIGEAPIVRMPLAPGAYKIKAVGPNGQKKTIDVTIFGGKDTTVPTIAW